MLVAQEVDGIPYATWLDAWDGTAVRFHIGPEDVTVALFAVVEPLADLRRAAAQLAKYGFRWWPSCG